MSRVQGFLNPLNQIGDARIRVGAFSSPAGDRSTPTLAETSPPLRTLLEYRWVVDRMTGGLSARWVDPSTGV
jgi:hypothetical protein